MTSRFAAGLILVLAAATLALGQPANDDCTAPTVITSLPFSDSLDVSAATSEAGDPYVPCGSFTKDIEALSGSVWYQFTASEELVLDVDTAGSDYDTVVAIWGGGCGTFERLACAGYSLFPVASEPTFNGRTFVHLEAGQTVLIEVTAWDDDSNMLSLSVDRAPAGHPAPTGPEFVVNTTQTSDQGGYSYRNTLDVCRSANDQSVVVWQSLQQDGDDWGIFAQRYAADGTPAGGEFQVNTYTTDRQYRPSVACGPSGDFVVAWQDQDPSAEVKARRFDGSGGALTGEVAVSSGGAEPVVGVDNGGVFTVVWRSGDIFVRRFDGTGTPLGPATSVGSFDFDFDVGVNGAGNAVVAWSDSYEVLAQRFDPGGSPVGPPLAVGDPGESPAVSIDPNGDFVVAWIGYDQDARARRFDSAGVGGAEVQVNEFTNINLSQVDVAADDDGSFVVAWTDIFYTRDVLARRVRADGTKIGDAEFVVGAVGAGPQQGAPHVAPGPSGEFVVAWSGYDGEVDYGSYAYFSGGYGVRAQRFAVAPFVATDTGLAGKKLVIVDKEALANKAKVVYVAKDAAVDKGAGGDPADLEGDFAVFYTDQPSSVLGTFVLPSPWRTNKATVAKYVNSTAPDGTGDVKVGVLKTGVVAKVVAKGLGDGASIDIFGGPPSAAGGLTAVLTLRNAGNESERRFCTRFAVNDGSTVVYKELAGGLGRKIVAKNGVPAPCP
jgi:hypothetical protein